MHLMLELAHLGHESGHLSLHDAQLAPVAVSAQDAR
jgi:hypothetical protein